jgi:transcriptional regulator with XRE-family HTH domain
MDEVEFGKRIYDLRKQAGLSQFNFAALCGMNASHIACFESGEGNRSLKTLNKICDGVGISLVDLFSDDTPKVHDRDEFVYQMLVYLQRMTPETKKVAIEMMRLLITIQ